MHTHINIYMCVCGIWDTKSITCIGHSKAEVSREDREGQGGHQASLCGPSHRGHQLQEAQAGHHEGQGKGQQW